MTNRKARRNKTKKEEIKFAKNAKAKFILMIISIFLMIFSVTQVYYLTKYTLGYEVSPRKLKVYKWVQLLVSGEDNSAI